jgi:hypothetical protein
MNGGAPAIDRAEQIRWWDALDVICGVRQGGVDAGLQMARKCQHPDAQWLVALFPAGGTAVTPQHLQEVMLEQGEDPRAMYLIWRVFGPDHAAEDAPHVDLLKRSAELGYAPAQAELSTLERGANRLMWAERSAAAGDRCGMHKLAVALCRGRFWNLVPDNLLGAKEVKARAMELFRAAAELDCVEAQGDYGSMAFGESDWQRFYWWGRAALKKHESRSFVDPLLKKVRSFAAGEDCRILCTVAPMIRKGLDVAKSECFGERYPNGDMTRLVRLLRLDGELRDRAGRAIACWSAVGLRHGIVKDIRVMIAKMAWEEVWRWGKLKR